MPGDSTPSTSSPLGCASCEFMISIEGLRVFDQSTFSGSTFSRAGSRQRRVT